jgi:hypothetical protein
MPDSEIHLLDDIAHEELRLQRGRMRLRIGLFSIAIQGIGFIFVFCMRPSVFYRPYYTLAAVAIALISAAFQWKYRTPKSVDS